MAEIEIRPLGLGDRDAWAVLRHALWPDASLQELRDELEGMIAEGLAGFGAFDDLRPVGWAEVSQRPHGDGCDTAPVAWLEGIYVVASHRRTGVGGALLEAVENWARQRDFSELGSDAELDNLTSRVSHARWGFDETERVVRFRKALR
jgi:aminoglycoside 6'-N-acetyltransferase I